MFIATDWNQLATNPRSRTCPTFWNFAPTICCQGLKEELYAKQLQECLGQLREILKVQNSQISSWLMKEIKIKTHTMAVVIFTYQENGTFDTQLSLSRLLIVFEDCKN